MRFFKFLFGKAMIVFLLVLLQVALFVGLFAFWNKLSPYYWICFTVTAAFTAAGVIIITVMLARQANPDFIAPWSVVFLLMPVFGVLVYLLFAHNKLRGRKKRRYRLIHDRLQECVPQTQSVKIKLKQADAVAYCQSEYLLKAGKLPVYCDTHTKYYGTGEAFFESLKQELSAARRFIFMSFFSVEQGMMWNTLLELLIQKVEEGVEVRFMYDDLGCMGKLKSNYYKKLRRYGIKCVKFNRFLPVASAVNDNRDHRKIVVIDGKAGFVTGGNIGDGYINVIKKYGIWKDSAILLKGAAVKNLTAMFLHSYGAQTGEDEDYARYLPDIEAGGESLGFVQPFGDGPVPLYVDRVAKNAIINIISAAQEYVYLTTPYLIMDFQLTEAVKLAARRGVDVRIVTPHIPDKKLVFLLTRSSYKPLIEAGVKIYEYTPGFMHSKNILCDDKTAVVSTVNLDYRSLAHHFECGVWLYGTPSISEVKRDFCEIFADSHEITREESKLSPPKKLAAAVLRLFAPLL